MFCFACVFPMFCFSMKTWSLLIDLFECLFRFLSRLAPYLPLHILMRFLCVSSCFFFLQFPAQQQQTRHQTTNLNHVNNNSIPNGGSHYQQHNYSSQVHQYPQQQQQQSPGLYHSIESYQDRGSTAATSLRLSYVTERILASILPARRAIRNGTTTPVPGFADEHERELIEMLEQKHEKVGYRIRRLCSNYAGVSWSFTEI